MYKCNDIIASCLISLLQAALNNPIEKSQLLQKPEKLREIINDIPVRQWLFEQGCLTDQPNRVSQAKDFIVMMMKSSRLIWGGGGKISPDIYDEALSRTWEWFIKDFGQYQPQKASLITWFNQKLRWNILDVIREKAKEEQRQLNLSDDEWIYPPAPELDRWDETIQEWLDLVQNNSHFFRDCQMRHYSDVNCQFLLINILQVLRDSGEFSWDILAQNYGVEVSVLKRFCRTRCFRIFKQLLPE